jgi:hypothetical protein
MCSPPPRSTLSIVFAVVVVVLPLVVAVLGPTRLEPYPCADPVDGHPLTLAEVWDADRPVGPDYAAFELARIVGLRRETGSLRNLREGPGSRAGVMVHSRSC